jgi:hypothetical protein
MAHRTPATIDDILGRNDPPPRNHEKVKGAMIYNHKTGGELQIMSASQFDTHKKLSNRKGQSSVLRNVLHGNGRLM